MGLPGYDYTGEAPEMPKKEDGGQTVKSMQKPSTEQIAEWGGFRTAEREVNESEDKPVRLTNPKMETDL